MGAAEALGGFAQDRFRHSIRIFDGIAVPEAKDSPTLPFEENRSARIMVCRLLMLGTVKLYGQLG